MPRANLVAILMSAALALLALGAFAQELAGSWTGLVVLLLLLAAFLLLAAGTWGLARRLTFAAFCAVLSLLSFEVLGLFAEHLSANTDAVYEDGYLGPHPVLGWGPQRPGKFAAFKWDAAGKNLLYRVTYTIDDNFLRQTQSNESGPVVAFFGDSWTFGEGVGDRDTLPQAFADFTQGQFHVLNFGFHGYGPEHFLRVMETRYHRQLLDGAKLFVFQTAPWHALRTSCKPFWMRAAPRYILVHGQPVFAGSC